MTLIFNSKNKDFRVNFKRLDFNDFYNKIINIILTFFWVITLVVSLILISHAKFQYIGMIVLLMVLDVFLNRNNADKKITLEEINKKVIKVDCFLRRDTRSVILKSYYYALNNQKDFQGVLFKNLLKDKLIFYSFIKLDIKPVEMASMIEKELENEVQNDPVELKKYVKELLKKSFEEAININDNQINKSALILSLIGEKSSMLVDKIANRFGFGYNDLHNALILMSLPVPNIDHLISGVGDFFRLRMKYGYKFRIDRAFMSRITDYLDKVSIDLTSLAQRMQIGFLIGHEREFNQMVQILLKGGSNNVMLIGEPGSGKETIIMHLARKIVFDEVPQKLFDKRMVMLNIGDITQGAENVGEMQQRLSLLIREIIEAGNIILYIPNIYNLKQTNIENTGMNAADFLKPIFQSNLIPVIGSTTAYEYHTIIEKDAEFANIFEKIKVEEVSEDEATRILSYRALAFEKINRVAITYKAIKRAVFLAKRFLPDKLLPSSADSLLKETIFYVKSLGKKVVCEDDVILIVENKTRIPISRVTKGEAESLLNMEKLIHQKLINQEEAVKSISESMREYRAGFSKKKGPIGTFLFVGPTGVGKTELSKVLADINFGSQERMIRFDMAEFQDENSINRFIGSADGKTVGLLTEAVKQNPFSLVLLDEFEKANDKILNLFLAVFDEGRLTDRFGRLVDFNNTIIICTSNAESGFIKQEIDKGTKYNILAEDLKKKLTNVFRPELLNRFTKILVFKELTKQHIYEIANLHLDKLKKLLLKEHGVFLEISDEVTKKVAELGYDPSFGARPLEGVIREKIRSKIVDAVLRNKLTKGSTVFFDMENNDFKMEIKNQN